MNKIFDEFPYLENVYSAKVLIKNGFVKEAQPVEEHNWGRKRNSFSR